jgi:hypothetical protein
MATMRKFLSSDSFIAITEVQVAPGIYEVVSESSRHVIVACM